MYKDFKTIKELTTINNSEKKLKVGGHPIFLTQKKNQKYENTGKNLIPPRNKKNLRLPNHKYTLFNT